MTRVVVSVETEQRSQQDDKGNHSSEEHIGAKAEFFELLADDDWRNQQAK